LLLGSDTTVLEAPHSQALDPRQEYRNNRVDLNPFHETEVAIWKAVGVVLLLAIVLTALQTYYTS
jgi:hypothetical protein